MPVSWYTDLPTAPASQSPCLKARFPFIVLQLCNTFLLLGLALAFCCFLLVSSIAPETLSHVSDSVIKDGKGNFDFSMSEHRASHRSIPYHAICMYFHNNAAEAAIQKRHWHTTVLIALTVRCGGHFGGSADLGWDYLPWNNYHPGVSWLFADVGSPWLGKLESFGSAPKTSSWQWWSVREPSETCRSS